MGYYRGVPHTKPSQRHEKIMSEMRARYLTHGKGCRSRARAIAGRTPRRTRQEQPK